MYRCSYSGLDILGHSRKHPYLPHGGNWKLTPLPPLDVLIHLLLSETIFYPLPLRTAEISSVGGVWTFSGTTHYANLYIVLFLPNIIITYVNHCISLKKSKISVDVHIIIFVLYAMIFACRLMRQENKKLNVQIISSGKMYCFESLVCRSTINACSASQMVMKVDTSLENLQHLIQG